MDIESVIGNVGELRESLRQADRRVTALASALENLRSLESDEVWLESLRDVGDDFRNAFGDQDVRMTREDWTRTRSAVGGLGDDLDALGWPPPPVDPPRAVRDLRLLDELLVGMRVSAAAFDSNPLRRQLALVGDRLEAILAQTKNRPTAPMLKQSLGESVRILGRAVVVDVAVQQVAVVPSGSETWRTLLFAACVVVGGLGRALELTLGDPDLGRSL